MQVKEVQELDKHICGNCYNHKYDGFVFVDELGELMRANYLTSAFPKFLESHSLRWMRFHDLRHPHTKHTTKNKSLQKQEPQTIKNGLIVWGSCFCLLHPRGALCQSLYGRFWQSL